MKTNYFHKFILLLYVLLSFFSDTFCNDSLKIKRFELFNTREGLSQNSVLCAYADHLGYLWFGTMNGLNRYDGYNFKIYKAYPGKAEALSNNRISAIWEDAKNILWVKTYDGYYHYIDRETDKFTTFPNYIRSREEKNSSIVSFAQTSPEDIWLCSSNSGVYHLVYDSTINKYHSVRYFSRGTGAITNNKTSFAIKDTNGDLWIGTENGLNQLYSREQESLHPDFQHLFIDTWFTSATRTGDSVWFGTKNKGILLYDAHSGKFSRINKESGTLPDNEVTLLKYSDYNNIVIIGTGKGGLINYGLKKGKFIRYNFGGHRITNVNEDHTGNLWVNTEEFGVTRISPAKQIKKFYQLTPKEIQPLVDDERQYFFEDSRGNLWIGLHGSGLALYNRTSDAFTFFRNDPTDQSTISSNFVHCITEDKSGILWVGTGQFNGGVNKIVTSNSSFYQLSPHEEYDNMAENVIRSVFYEKKNGRLWVATKAGELYIYNKNLQPLSHFSYIPLKNKKLPGHNIYCMMQDKDGYLWLGSKGAGILVSTQPLDNFSKNCSNLSFYHYRHDPGDTTSLSNNMVYSIINDREGNIWIGTYGGGVNKVTGRDSKYLYCKRLNTSNSALSSDFVRKVFEDSRGYIWLATTFGLNRMISRHNPDSLIIDSYYYDPKVPGSISYNDIIHIFEDSQHRMWFGTFGGGIDLLLPGNIENPKFESFSREDGLTNDAVFGILEDSAGMIWLSTENGLSRFNFQNKHFDNFDYHDGLPMGSFSENTCCPVGKDKLAFGSTKGVILISPDNILKDNFVPPLVLTNFQLFNKDVNINDKDSPLKKTISSVNRVVLKYYQSSFSVEYAALSFFDPRRNQYMFKLEGLDKEWNKVKNQRKATYTNLKPGHYTLLVKAANWDGTWNEKPVKLDIIIRPPWWKTIVAYIIYLIIGIFIANIIRKIAVRYAKLRNDLKVEKKVNEIKLQFFTNISHEIRTPLTLILGPLEEVRNNKNLPVRVHQELELMYRNGKRMLRLINQLLDFRKIQNEKMKLKISQLDLVKFVTDICENFTLYANKKKIGFKVECQQKAIPVWVDPDKLDVVLFNILSNAFKFTPEGKSVKVKIKTNQENNTALIQIKDEGVGIQEDKIPILFERYTSLSAEKKYFNSTGIGLALSKEIIRLHKGDILVKSRPSHGSIFTISLLLGNEHFNPEDIENKLPDIKKVLEANDEPAIMLDEAISEIPETNNNEKKPVILVVEDNLDVSNYIFHILEKDFHVTCVSNGEKGLDTARRSNPDLIITDIMMPVMDGIEMTKRIKKNFTVSHIPVIMLTAKSNFDDQIEGIESGAEAYILKPFNPVYLLAICKNFIHQRRIILERFPEKSTIDPGDIKINSKDEDFLNNVIKLIQKHYNDPEFNVEKLVELSAVGRTVFYNKLKGLTGLSPVEFLREMRLKIAARVLSQNEYNVAEVAYMTGFNDEKYFSRCFKAQFGKSPSEYKKEFVEKS